MKRSFFVILLIFILFFCGCENDINTLTDENTVKIVFAVQRDNTGIFREITESFVSDHKNINVKLIELPEETNECYRVLSSILAGNEIVVDIFAAEDIWLKNFIELGYVEPIKNVEVKSSEYPEHISDVIYENGKLYAVPLHLDCGILFYRKDLVDQCPNYRQIADSSMPFSVRTQDGEDTLCILRECVMLEGDTAKGLELYRKLYDADGADTDCISEFKSGRTAFLRSWSSKNAVMYNYDEQMQGKIRADVMRKGDSIVSTARLYCTAVNSACDESRISAVWEFLKYLNSESVQLKICKETGTLPLKYKYYDSPVICDYNTYNETFAKYLDKLSYRPFDSGYMIRSEAAYKTLKNYLDNKIGAEEAADAIESITE